MKRINEKIISFGETYLSLKKLSRVMNIEYKEIRCIRKEYNDNWTYGHTYDNCDLLLFEEIIK